MSPEQLAAVQAQKAIDQQLRKSRLRRGPPDASSQTQQPPPLPEMPKETPPLCQHGPPYRLMVIYDVSFKTPSGEIGWAYWRRAVALKKHAPADWQVDIFQYSDAPWSRCGEYDLIFNLEYCGINRHQIKSVAPHVPVAVSFNSDARRRQNYWHPAISQSDFLIVNNREAYEFYGKQPRTCCISNGVDTEVFRATTHIADRKHKAVFAGSTGTRKQKGWPEVFWPLEKIASGYGFETDFRPVDEISEAKVMPTEKTVEWYNSASYILCASLSEGSPNVISEGVACGCVAVSYPVGNILEWGRDRENCVIVPERTPQAFLAGLEYAREHRERLSAAGMETLRNWSYGAPGHRAKWYFALFEKILREGVDSVKPFDFSDTHWTAI